MSSPFDTSAFASLKERDFRLYWLGSTLSRLGSTMQVTAVAWHLYQLTHQPLSLGLIGLVQAGPIMTFTLLGGAWADSLNRRRLMLAMQIIQLVLCAGLAALTGAGTVSALAIYAFIFLNALASSVDGSAHAVIAPELVPRALLGNAIALKNMSYSVAGILGPALAGILISRMGVGTIYGLNAVSFLAVFIAILAVRAPLAAPAGRATGAGWTSRLQQIRDGFGFVRQERILLTLMVIDFFAVVAGEARTLLPVFAQDVLHVGAEGLGVLAAAPGAGALIGAALMAAMPSPRRPGKFVLLAIACYGACAIVYGASTSFWLSWAALAAAGIADTMSMTLRQTIPLLLAPEAMRGRVNSINTFFANTGNQLGEFEAGAVAQWLGPREAMMLGGAACLAMIGYVAATDRSVSEFEHREDLPAGSPA